MHITVSQPVLNALREAYEQPHPGPARPEAAAITDRIIASGWAGWIEIESLLIATEPRLWRIKTQDLLQAFGVALQPVFERPARGTRDAEGIERVSAVDLACFLILLERAGLAVDPAPLCKALAPAIAAKRLLTAPELTVHWRAQDVPTESLTVGENPIGRVSLGPSYLMPSGHRVQIYLKERPDIVSAVTIAPPQGQQRNKAHLLPASI